MKRLISIFSNLLIIAFLHAQTPQYTPANGHSHNDYAQKNPFTTAFNAGMGSIEADVFLIKKNLYVAHDSTEIKMENTLEKMYLKPLDEAAKAGKLYPLQLLIDIKSQADSTLDEIVRQIGRYPDVFIGRIPVKCVISGNRPMPERWEMYPKYILFDGRPNENYTPEQWQRVGLMSDSVERYTDNKKVTKETLRQMKNVVDMAHKQGKKMRFWGTSDDKKTWQILMNMGADYINTDVPDALRAFLIQK